jgi:hypothetical protein
MNETHPQAPLRLALIASFISRDWRLFAIGWVLSLVGFALAPPPGRQA